MRRFPFGWSIFLFAVAMAALGYVLYIKGASNRMTEVARIRNAPSVLVARMLVRYAKPPIFEEEYRMADVEGVSTFSYRVRGYDGKQVTVTAPKAAIYDVSFFFGKLDQDGIWQLMDKAPRPDADATYTVYVKQQADFKEGERTVVFTSPHYWATTAGRQYEIDLRKNQPGDLLKLQSTSLANPHYQAIVDDFRSFGPAEFRHNVAVALARVRAGK
ncbi:MAG TPA: hypothetical protein VMH02_10300 [Verrucomicrobiae bacterium]|nr:hypothetical protein [Verrucomicrobiae bacterium]